MSNSATVLNLARPPAHLGNDPVLRRIKDDLVRLYGSRLAGVVLYGSRARGDNRPDSDIDLLVLLKGQIDFLGERLRLAELAADIGLATDEAPSFLLEPEGALSRPTIFMQSILRDGVLL